MRIFSLVVGIPASLGFLFLGWESIRLHALAPVLDQNRPTGNPLIDLLIGGARLVARAFAFFGAVGEWALVLLTGICFAVAVAAWSLFFISRGIHSGRSWARVLGILFALGIMLLSLATLAALRRPLPLTLSGAAALVSAYVIWTLALRFA